MKKLILVFLFLIASAFARDIKVQVLGSGGPELNDNRASSAYIIWVDNKSKILVDFGGGAALRFEEVKAKIEDLDIILLTHLHIDHTADLPALLKASFFSNRFKDIEIYGPDKGLFVPDTKTFINRLFENKKGAWEYMGDFLDGNAQFKLQTTVIPFSKEIKTIYDKNNIKIEAISVNHGPIPATAYKVSIDGKSITFSGDMSGKYSTLEKLAVNSNILIAHNAVPKGAQGVAKNLHMTPDIIGYIAKEAKVKNLVLSHRMLRTLGKEDITKKEIRKYYEGKINFAEDKSIYLVQ
ncbi:MBL fold metallo-hydrolase [Poseidonibacter lekithochrous]|uniref:MBL fold metallo-hydrolase n=1 Tax=Poseidonibacter lekithochrous TaxID=1904463 RepID=UPI0008FCB773|nr:MBL fold metallo-hydrolase [Poseidonibacter lekithochrous]QKJ22215.1 MBL fold metallohydrolase [Poseidonibacter lekithochrous]